MMHSKMPTVPEKLAKPSTKERVLTPAEHRMKRMHDKKTQAMAESIAAALNQAVRAGK
jgi:hypothetical protein